METAVKANGKAKRVAKPKPQPIYLTDQNGEPIGKLRNLHQDNVLVLMDHHEKRDEVTAGGIYIPQTARDPDEVTAAWATVVACGPGWQPGYRCSHCGGSAVVEKARFEEPEFRPGDRVLVENPYTGDRVYVDGVEHRIIRMANVIAVEE